MCGSALIPLINQWNRGIPGQFEVSWQAAPGRAAKRPTWFSSDWVVTECTPPPSSIFFECSKVQPLSQKRCVSGNMIQNFRVGRSDFLGFFSHIESTRNDSLIPPLTRNIKNWLDISLRKPFPEVNQAFRPLKSVGARYSWKDCFKISNFFFLNLQNWGKEMLGSALF